MTWEAAVVDGLRANDVDLVAYLPDGALSGLIERVEADGALETVTVAREEEAVGVLSGAWLGHRRGALLCQSSGLATTINALGSLSKPARIPFVGVVSRRGDLGEFNDAQVPFGYGLGGVLDALGLRHHAIDGAAGEEGATAEADVRRRVDLAAKTAFSTGEPYLLVLEPTLTGAKDEF